MLAVGDSCKGMQSRLLTQVYKRLSAATPSFQSQPELSALTTCQRTIIRWQLVTARFLAL